MSPEFRKVALIAATLGLLVSLFVALRSEEAEEPPPTTAAAVTDTASTTTTTAVEAEPLPEVVDVDAAAGEIVRAKVSRGTPVVLNVTAGVADSVHVHGYDLTADVAPGRPARLSFVADVAGRFEIELEERHDLVAELTVEP